MTSIAWNDSQIAMLKQLWKEGLSATQIADKFGNGATRNAVIGKVHRLNLAGRPQTPRQPKTPEQKLHENARRRERRAAKRLGQAPAAVSTPKANLPPAPAIARPAPPVPVLDPTRPPVPITELAPNGCKWPVSPHNALSHVFCNAPRRRASSYCEAHHRKSIGLCVVREWGQA